MKGILLTLIFCGLSFIAKSQNASVEKSTFGIQTGFIGIWVHNEAKVSNQIALRSELGLDPGFINKNDNNVTGFFLAPAITIEPRWYYNLNKRQNKSKRIDGNSGNFISIKTTYHPDWFIISDRSDLFLIPDLSIVPTWGFRRPIGNHFITEAGFGVGYVKYFNKENIVLSNKSDVAINLHLRIGYRF